MVSYLTEPKENGMLKDRAKVFKKELKENLMLCLP